MGSYSRHEDMKLMQMLKKKDLELSLLKATSGPCMQKQKQSLQRLVPQGLKLVSVFVAELFGSLGCFRHVGLARYSSLNHLLPK